MSLMAILGLNGNAFKAGLDKAKAEATKSGGELQKGLLGALKENKIFQAIASPIGAATGVAVGFIGMITAKVDELRERAKDIKIGSDKTNLSFQQFQPLMYASQAVGADPEAAGKGIVKIAEAQAKIKAGGPGAAEALSHFARLGITMKDIENAGPQEIFLKIAEAMHVSKLSGDQMAAGAELLGKSFEALEPVFKRGFNNPMDQMKVLTDEEIKSLNRMGRSMAILKETWSTAVATLANGAVSVLGTKGMNPDEETAANEKRLQERLNAQQSAKAQAATQARQRELMDKEERAKNLAKAAESDKQTTEEERQAKLRALNPGQRLEMLKKETKELERQKALLEQKLKTEADAADAPKIAELGLQIAKNKAQQGELSRSAAAGSTLNLTDLQKNAGAAFASGAMNPAVKSESHLAKIVVLMDKSTMMLQRLAEEKKSTDKYFRNVEF